MNVDRESPFCFKSISHLKSLTLLCVFEMTLNLIYTIEVTMFILLELSRICYFRVEKSERLTVIFIIITSNCNKSLAITFWVISLKTILVGSCCYKRL